MADAAPSQRPRLVGQSLLYSISIFVSLGVFLVRPFPACRKAQVLIFANSSDMTKGALIPPFLAYPHISLQCHEWDHHWALFPEILQLSWTNRNRNRGRSFRSGSVQYVEATFNQALRVSTPEIVTSVAAGRVGDIIGRRGTLFAGAIIFTIGGAIQTVTVGFWTMVLGRITSGLGVGLLSSVAFECQISSIHVSVLFEQNYSSNISERNLPTKPCVSIHFC